MCLSYPPNGLTYDDMANNYFTAKLGNEAQQKYAAHGASVSCDNTLCAVTRSKTGGIIMLTSIPVTGTETVVFPINPDHVAFLKSCAEFKCTAAALHGITRPHEYVPYCEHVEYMGPIYRSLGTSESAAKAPEPPEPPEPIELKVFANPDGGYVAILCVSPFLKTDVTMEKRASLSTALLKCLEDGLAGAKIDPKRVFGPGYDKEDNSSTFGLLGFLFDACVSECDIVIGVMPEGKTEGRFTFLYDDPRPEPGGTVPMLGLAHGDRVASTPMHDTYYVVTNDNSIRLRLEASKPLPDEKRKGADTTIIPQPSQTYCLDHYKSDPFAAMHNPDNPFYNFDADDPFYRPTWRGTRGDATHGNTHWQSLQLTFQQPLIEELFAMLAAYLDDNECAPMDSVEQMCVSDIKGLPIPRDTVEAIVDIDAAHMNSPSGQKRQRSHVEAAASAVKSAVAHRNAAAMDVP